MQGSTVEMTVQAHAQKFAWLPPINILFKINAQCDDLFQTRSDLLRSLPVLKDVQIIED